MKEKLVVLIQKLEKDHDFDAEFYLTYIGQLNDGDYSDWADSHFDDNLELGFTTGQTALAEDIIATLKQILEEAE